MQTPELVTLKIGKKEYKVAKQAQVVFYLYLVSIVVAVLSFFVNPAHGLNIINLLVALFTLVLVTYVTNCLVVGQCNTYAWVVVAFAALSTTFSVGAFVYLLTMSGKYKMQKPKTRGSKGK